MAGGVDTRESMQESGQGVYGIALYIAYNFAVNVKLLLKKLKVF